MPRETRTVALQERSIQFQNGTVLEVAPYAGEVTQLVAGPGQMRASRLPAEADSSAEVAQALEDLGFVEKEVLRLTVTGYSPLRSYRAGRPGNDQIVLRPKVAPGEVPVVLYQDESNGLSWHFPDGFLEQALNAAGEEGTTTAGRRPRASGLRGPGGPVFTIPARTNEARAALKSPQLRIGYRGRITSLGRKILKLFVLPVAAKAIASPLKAIVGKIERKHRQNLIRALTPDNYQRRIKQRFRDWETLSGGNALLVVHGIFSSTDGVLSGLPKDAMGALFDHYQKRVIAFDHLTVSKDPEQNARDFLTALKEAAPDRTFDFDILCHSRGGIVSRTLAERGRDVFPDLNARFGKIYFVATPNSGSPLGDPRHVVEMLDVFTNLLTAFPDGPVLYTIEVFLAIVKLLAYAAGTKLPGIAAMGPQKGSYIAEVLNRGGKASKLYAAASADYTPDPTKDNAFFNGRFANYILDRVFGGTANDLIVPEAGVYAKNGHKAFPIENVLRFGTEDRVWHTDFFRQPRTLDHIGRHFGIPALETSLAPEVGTTATAPPITQEVEEPAYPATVLRGIPVERTPVLTRGVTGGLSGYRSPGGGGSFGVGAYTSYVTPPTHGGRLTRGRAPVVPAYRAPSPQARKKPAKKRQETEAPAELRREPFIDFKEKVQAGATEPLIVRLEEAVQQATAKEILTLSLPVGHDHVELTVTLTASGFDVTPEGEVIMKVCRERDPKLEKVRFKLAARDLGPEQTEPAPREITAEFWLGATCVGSVTHGTVVVPKGLDLKAVAGDGSFRSRSVRLPQEPREDCDLVIYVEGHDRPGESPFNVRLNIDLPGRAAYRRVGQLALPGGSLSQYLDSFFHKHFNRFPTGGTAAAVKKWESQLALGLADLGKDLWTFLPQDFRTEYFALREAGALPRSILVNSDEMVFPWELVIPNEVIRGTQEVLDPLGVAHVLGRWKPDLTYRPEPQRLPVKNFCVLNPKYPAGDDLPWSAQEVAELKALFPKLTVLPKADADTVRTKLLERSDIQILHYSGHGDYDPQNADLNHLILEGGDTLDALTLGRARLTAEGQPILYLNACSSGQTAIAAGRMGGFASRCLTGGCSGIIAPYWPVKDDSAKEFSLGLYRKLKGGLSIGEALQELRRDNPQNPTFLAYSYFGDPWARVLF